IEDTALYRFNRLLSLNEVGGEPGNYGGGVRAFHADAEYRVRHWPHEMLATSTHDTKRSEDVRARLNVLSELTTPWRDAVRRSSRVTTTCFSATSSSSSSASRASGCSTACRRRCAS